MYRKMDGCIDLDRLIDWLIEWITHPELHGFIGRSMGWLIDRSIDWVRKIDHWVSLCSHLWFSVIQMGYEKYDGRRDEKNRY